MKRRAAAIVIVVILVAGLAFLLYPTVSDIFHKREFQSRISEYTKAVAVSDDAKLEELWESAQEYNRNLKANRFYELTPSERAEYDSQLILDGSNVLGTLSIPSIKVSLPLYHGSDDEVLSNGIGHIEGTSLPVGGTGSHSVISGHRGLPSARLLTDLDKVEVGDIFILEVLGHTLTYETDLISVVLPDDVSLLEIDPKADFCTIVTCTPYGVNSHRLLVRGHRTDNAAADDDVRITPDALQIDRAMAAAAGAVPLIIVLVILIVSKSRTANKRKHDENDKKL
ncbi:MAG: class C sortase [Clostridia bacterium]|nr:class C sortase [Clostridia bacterium]